ncbi:hypothetical protein Tco_1121124 [Tanacetum coccineum]|uniref:Eukaryotic translation initiation factor 3 subunit G N-terminal domain-containing protein n=1 Tax=Tanacetum coccineum TaxID=301880 RepID=A0ABQ5J0G5_9ASTR
MPPRSTPPSPLHLHHATHLPHPHHRTTPPPQPLKPPPRELCDDTFSGSDNKDANEHIERVIEIADLFTIPDVTQDQLMLHFSLSHLLEPKYCPPAQLLKRWRKSITSSKSQMKLFIKLGDDSKNFSEMSSTLLDQYEIKKVNKRVNVAQVGCESCNGPHYTKDCSLMEEAKTLEEAYYTKFGVPFPQGGRYKAAAPRFYQRNNGNPSYQERRQTMEESLSKFMAKSAKRHDENSKLIKVIQASMDVAIINQGASIKALEI